MGIGDLYRQRGKFSLKLPSGLVAIGRRAPLSEVFPLVHAAGAQFDDPRATEKIMTNRETWRRAVETLPAFVESVALESGETGRLVLKAQAADEIGVDHLYGEDPV